MRLPEMDERYDAGHVETIYEYLNRGGSIVTVAPGISADRLEWPSLVSTILGESPCDIDRGFAWADLDGSTREALATREHGSLMFDSPDMSEL